MSRKQVKKVAHRQLSSKSRMENFEQKRGERLKSVIIISGVAIVGAAGIILILMNYSGRLHIH